MAIASVKWRHRNRRDSGAIENFAFSAGAAQSICSFFWSFFARAIPRCSPARHSKHPRPDRAWGEYADPTWRHANGLIFADQFRTGRDGGIVCEKGHIAGKRQDNGADCVESAD